mmetsp:Transcript_9384/g.22311  ORF Transcript_9384/g.22311 Transcript_9384/m.22311 type:complete len:190 (-) Transcript_9384:110-679(-)
MGKEADELRHRAKEAWEAKHKAAESSPVPQPMRNLYRGKTHQRIVQEQSANTGTKEATRSKAQARRDASLRYAKLVNELSDAGGGVAASNPAEGISGFDSAAVAHPAAASGPSAPVDMKALGAAASALNNQVRQKEEQVQAMRAAAGPPPAPPSDELLDNHTQLSQLYVQAIRAKLDLFEGLAGSGGTG